ncbi:MAG: DcaP family trimeric outer membrane transporter [Mucinivorans sp.]
MKNLSKFLSLACGVALFTSVPLCAQSAKYPLGRTNVVIVGPSNAYDHVLKAKAYFDFSRSLRNTPQQVGMPTFLFTDSKAKASFALGGFVNFRTAYDFNNVVGNRDFVTFDIPMSRNIQNQQRILMDGSTSRLYFKTVVNTRSLGAIEAYIETDFRGGNYNLRLREAYISFMGFTLGQTVTTFCDLGAGFNTIDFEGPNGYTYGRNLMVQYKHSFDEHWSMAIAAELPVVSGTYGSDYLSIAQRVPDIPAYVQYSWNKGQSHIRASGIFRDLYYGDNGEDKVKSEIGWGAQLSGTIKLCSAVQFYGQVLYGRGITPYISDLQGVGLDLVPSNNNHRMSSPEALTWLAGLQVNITPKLPMTIGYSQVRLYEKDSFNPQGYKMAQYIVGNLFYNITRSLNVGVEYLYGTRYNQNGDFGRASRVQASVQFNF